MKYLSTAQIARKWGISQRRVSLLCAEGRIPGAQKTGKSWIVPDNSSKPDDPRNFSYEIKETDDMEICEDAISLNINPVLFFQAERLFRKEGKSISMAISDFLEQYVKNKNQSRIGMGKGLIHCIEDINVYDRYTHLQADRASDIKLLHLLL